MTEITALIRYKDSAGTLPEVLSALSGQSRKVDRILGVNTGSSDGSTDLLQAEGAKIVKWEKPYHHSQVLNYGISQCETPWVLCLSSHTVMKEAGVLERMAGELRNERTCACGIKWDEDAYYSDLIDWQEMQSKGMKFGSIYTNSLGLLRRELWKSYAFDETMNGMEDYDWAIHFLREGYSVSRITADFGYKRASYNRLIGETARTFMLAERYGLDVHWLGYRAALTGLLANLPGRLMGNSQAMETFDTCYRRLQGALFWKSWDHRFE